MRLEADPVHADVSLSHQQQKLSDKLTAGSDGEDELALEVSAVEQPVRVGDAVLDALDADPEHVSHPGTSRLV